MKLFVWDFHGTLEKGNEFAVIEISNHALQKHGFSERFTHSDAARLYGKKWYEYFEYLLPNAPHTMHVLLQQTSFELSRRGTLVAKYMRPNDHIHEVLRAIHTSEHLQILISNTDEESLPLFLKLTGITEFFNRTAFAVMAHSREVKRSKVDVIAEYLASIHMEPEIISIGDSEKDMQLIKYFNGKGYWYKHPGQPVPIIPISSKNVVAINDLREVLREVEGSKI